MRVLLAGDAPGVRQSLGHVPAGNVCGLVGASNRPQYHGELRATAARLGVPLLVQPRAGTPGYALWLEKLRELAPGLLLCNSYSMLLRPEALTVPGLCVNVHGGLVPEFRGSNPIQWALVTNAAATGCTVHVMRPEVDAGPVLAQRRIPIALDDTWLTLKERTSNAADELLAAVLPGLLRGVPFRPAPQDESRARTWPHRTPEDGRLSRDMPIQRIYNTVRALVAPLPGAFWDDGPERETWDAFLPLPEVARRVLGRRQWAGGMRLAAADGPSPHPLRFAVLRGTESSLFSVSIEGNMRVLRMAFAGGDAPDGAVWQFLLEACRREFPDSRICREGTES